MGSSKKHAIFILTHGRPNKVVTYTTLRRCGYTGPVYLIVDDEDKSAPEYVERYGDMVVLFSKKDYHGKFDIMDNFGEGKVIVYARNACYDIARNLGIDYFFEYEDDYIDFEHKYVDGEKLKPVSVRQMDKLVDIMIDCLNETGATTLAFSQGGDHIGGAGSLKSVHLKRKAMNSFVFKVNKDPKDDCIFIGRMNDDVNTYLTQGKIGKLFFQFGHVVADQMPTQTNSGGNTGEYKKFGTYVKSFYSVIAEPSCCKISAMETANARIHHSVNWKNAVPKIISEKWRKCPSSDV